MSLTNRSYALAWPSGYMSREIAVCTTGTGLAATDFCAAVIVFTRHGVASLCLAKQWYSAMVREAMAAMKSGPFNMALSISLTDRPSPENL